MSENPAVIQGDLPGQAALREWAEERRRYWAAPPRGTCAGCGAPDELLGSLEAADAGPENATHCAECRRGLSNRRAQGSYPCDQCGGPDAFRDPVHRRDELLCGRCHEKDGYFPTERAMVTRVAVRVGVTHTLGRKALCILRTVGTPCGGEVKQRSKHGLICNRHWDPVKYDANKG